MRAAGSTDKENTVVVGGGEYMDGELKEGEKETYFISATRGAVCPGHMLSPTACAIWKSAPESLTHGLQSDDSDYRFKFGHQLNRHKPDTNPTRIQ